MIMIDDVLLKEVAPHVPGRKGQSQATIIAGIGAVMTADLEAYDITTRLRIAHFIAQTCHESDGYCTTVEYASGQAYEGRVKSLGNTEKGDGPRFKGRGIIQITGRANYTTYGKALNLDLVEHPELAAEPRNAVLIACQFWKDRGLNALADQDNIVGITKRINGGLTGLSSRQAYLVLAKQALARMQATAIAGTAPSSASPVLRRGSKGEAVVALQTQLQAAGYPVAVDGDYGAATELAVTHFQEAKKLEADGIAGPATQAALGVPAQAAAA